MNGHRVATNGDIRLKPRPDNGKLRTETARPEAR